METEVSRKGRQVSEMDQVKVMEGWILEVKLMNFSRSGREHEAALIVLEQNVRDS